MKAGVLVTYIQIQKSPPFPVSLVAQGLWLLQVSQSDGAVISRSRPVRAGGAAGLFVSLASFDY